jgi:hypothetical protein
MPFAFREGLRTITVKVISRGERGNEQVIVVLTRPTLAKSDIFAKSVANSGVSTIFSRSALEHRGEFIKACT